MAHALIVQPDWGAGIYRGREAPPNAAYDLVNALVDDEGQVFKRGGSAYKTTSDTTATILGLADVQTAAGQRTLWWTATQFGVLDATDLTPSVLYTDPGGATDAAPPYSFSRVGALGGMALMARERRFASGVSPEVFAYAGSRKTASFSASAGAGAGVTNGSKTLTYATGGFTANVDAGMIVQVVGDAAISGLIWTGVVEKVNSDTSLTMVAPYPGTTGSYTSTTLYHVIGGAPSGAGTWTRGYVAGAGGRALLARGTLLHLSRIENPLGFVTGQYHEMPTGAEIIGLETLGSTALVFTTLGVWTISNMELDPLDDVGNVQQTERRANDLILWGNPGVAAWAGGIVMPATDNVYVMAADGSVEPLGQGIRPLLQSYVKSGYQPGTAVVHRGHYFLPILNGSTLVDVLVCRLDRGAAWTRWSGHAAATGYAQRIGSATRSPKLWGIAGLRVSDLTDTFLPSASNASEADATVHPFTLDTIDYDGGGPSAPSTATKVRVQYECAAAATPTVSMSFSRGLEGSSYTALTALGDTPPATSDGSSPAAWLVAKRAPAIRFRFSCASAVSNLKLRRLELSVRQARGRG